MRRLFELAVLTSVAALAGCVGDAPAPAADKATGSLGGACFPNGTCNAGLVCVVPDTCVAAPPVATDAGSADVGAADSGSDGGACALLAWWRGQGDPSDERNVYNLTWTAGAQYASGFELSGTNFLVASKKLSQPEMSVEARIRPIMPEGTIISTWDAQGSGSGFWLGLEAGHLTVRVNGMACASASPLVASSWVHVAATYQNGTCVLYVNGKKDQLVALPAGPIADAVPPHVGASASGIVQTAMFHGTIAELAVWSRVLEPSEVATLANESPPTKCR